MQYLKEEIKKNRLADKSDYLADILIEIKDFTARVPSKKYLSIKCINEILKDSSVSEIVAAGLRL